MKNKENKGKLIIVILFILFQGVVSGIAAIGLEDILRDVILNVDVRRIIPSIASMMILITGYNIIYFMAAIYGMSVDLAKVKSKNHYVILIAISTVTYFLLK